MEKGTVTSTLENVVEELKGLLKSLPCCTHTDIKQKHAIGFKSLVSACNGRRVVLQVDFSENATNAAEREREREREEREREATIFTIYAWIDNESIGAISDYLNHTKYGRVLRPNFPA